MITIRRCEKYTNWEATDAFQFNPEDFRSLSKTFDPYEGDSEIEFTDYIDDLLESTDVYEVCEELEDLDLTSASEMLSNLVEAEMHVYSSTTDKYGQIWTEHGIINEDYRKTGGFEIRYSTLSE